MENSKRLCAVILWLCLCIGSSRAQWVQTSGPIAGDVLNLASSGSMVVGASGQGAFRSLDNGRTWSMMGFNIANINPRRFCVSGSNVYAADYSSVIQSTDMGANWSRIESGLPGFQLITAMASSGTTLFIGTQNDGLYRMTKTGSTWSVDHPISDKYITSIYASGGTLVASDDWGFIYRSTGDGTSWTLVSNIWGGGIQGFCSFGSEIYAADWFNGVKRSGDNGVTWKAMNLGLWGQGRNATSLAVLGVKIYVGTHSGVYYSSSGDSTWTPIDTGLTDLDVTSLVSTGENLIAGTRTGGVYLSTDKGMHWVQSIPAWKYSSIVTMANFGNDLFVGALEGAYLSTSNGTSWKRLMLDNRITGNWRVNATAFVRSGTTTFAATNAGVYISPDNGTTWVAATKGLWSNRNTYSLASSGEDIYVGTYFGVLHTMLKDTVWSLYKNGIASETAVNAIVISGSTLYAGTDRNGVYRTTPQDRDWIPLNKGLTNLSVTSMVKNDHYVFVGTQNGIFRLGEGDTSWVSVRIPVPYQNVSSLTVFGNTIFAASGWVYKSSNDGMNWSEVSNGPFGGGIAVSDTFLFAGGNDAGGNKGVWRCPLSEILASANDNQMLVPTKFSLNQNYPNPFNPSTTISFSLPSRSFVTVKIFDVMGREVATLVSEQMPEGKYSRVWNASGMPSGVYFYRLQAGAYTETKRLVILK